MVEFVKLLSGYRDFKATTFHKEHELIRHKIALGEKPRTVVITSSGLFISPEKILSCNPGELFVIRNVGGLVPPYSTEGANGTISAVEYGVTHFDAENVIVLGHSHCEGIRSLMHQTDEDKKIDALQDWLSIVQDAKAAVLQQLPNEKPPAQQRACEQEAILVCLRNLLSYPCISERMDENKLNIFGLYYDIENGDLFIFNPDTQVFDSLD